MQGKPKKQSTGQKIAVELLKGVIRHFGAPSQQRRPAQKPQPFNGGCGGCKGR